MQIIFHLDFDSYFVSAHLLIDKSLRNKNVVISYGHNRSIIIAASYEAKKRGIRVPMPLYKAKNLINDLIVIEPNYPLYNNLSAKIFEFIANKYTQKIEIASIDECYIEVSKFVKTPEQAIKLAQKIQQNLHNKFHLPCSFGISTNKFVAKMSTQINKPYGITLTKSQNFLKIFGQWDIIKFHGIGLPSVNKLKAIKIFTIYDLANSNIEDLKPIFGVNAQKYLEKANGRDNSPINSEMNNLKSIGNSITFQDYDRSTRYQIIDILSNLTQIVATRAYNRNVVGNVVRVGIKSKGSQDVKIISKQKKLTNSIYKYEDILQVGIYLFDQIWEGQTIKFIGISLNDLHDRYNSTYQTSIFDKTKQDNKSKTIIKNVNQKLKYRAVFLGNEQINKNKQTRYLQSDRILKHYNKN